LSITLAAAVAAAAVLSAASPAADFEAEFTSGPDGFHTRINTGAGQTEPISQHVAAGGNPGGFIRHVPVEGQTNAEFIPPVFTGLGDYGKTISFDMRGTAPSGSLLVILFTEGSGGVYCEQPAPTTGWTRRTFLLHASDPCWQKAVGGPGDASPQDFEAAIVHGGLRISANFGTTDLDSFRLRPGFENTPPVVRVKRVRKNAKAGTAKVIFTAVDDRTPSNRLKFTCKLDGRKAGTCDSPRLFRGVKPGEHTVRIVAADAEGAKSKPAVRTFRQRRP
jgi:hypothetical protein